MKSKLTFVPNIERLEDRSIPGSLLGLLDPPAELLADLLAPATAVVAGRCSPALAAKNAPTERPTAAPAPTAQWGENLVPSQFIPHSASRAESTTTAANRVSSQNPAAASQFEVRYFLSRSAFAFLDSTEGCVNTQISLTANEVVEGTLVPQSTPTRTALLGVTVFVADICSEQIIVDAEGFSFDTSFFVATGDLRSATYSGTIETLNLPTGTLLNFEVDVTWTAAGRVTADTTIERSENEATATQLRERPAVATGTVTNGAINYLNQPMTDAAISSVVSLSVTT